MVRKQSAETCTRLLMKLSTKQMITANTRTTGQKLLRDCNAYSRFQPTELLRTILVIQVEHSDRCVSTI